MSQLKIFINITRLNRPIGFMLLFWPCMIGLTYAHQINQNLKLLIFFSFLFFIGSILMRSAGCIFNDIIDKDVDKKVFRTKNRPIPKGLISISRAFIYVVILCLLALLILLQFNYFTILLGFASMFFAFAYPFMKRITYWPQLFLGLTFNWGIIMGWTSVFPELNYEIIILYVAAIFWTLGYDTIYGLQDVNDDEIIGMKSTSIKFKKNPKIFIGFCYSCTTLLIACLFKDSLNFNFKSIFFFIFVLTLVLQIYIFNFNKPKDCLKAFKLNNFSGLTFFLYILI